ncbi:unnamed protein product [Cylindrotheca closterium]|uniref:Uncharacterized protein n=1 Tax=Cylindrotheca closterium TaxID=2856 RepID=A0AAD2JH86_9STRA|nr:unnamed protein product [Cylindrotheca closterium]
MSSSSNKDKKQGKTPTFMDRFALHLAKELVGSKTVLQVLNQQLHGDSGKTKEHPLYWRSDLFLEDPADMMNASKWPCYCSSTTTTTTTTTTGTTTGNQQVRQRQHLLYLDAKFEFICKNNNDDDDDQPTHKKQVQVTWGCFVLHHSKSGNGNDDSTTTTTAKTITTCKNNYGMYYKSKPMRLHCLEKHVESMDIDLPEQPQNMAKFMRPALVGEQQKKNSSKGGDMNAKKAKDFHIQLKDSSNTFDNNDTEKTKKTTLQLELYYEELNDKGVLTLELEEQASSPYNELAMEPLYLREIMRSSGPEEEEIPPTTRTTSQSNSQGSLGSPFGGGSISISQSHQNNQPMMSSQNSVFGSPINATPRPAARERNMVDVQLDQALDVWFRQTNDDESDNGNNDNSKVAASSMASSPIAGAAGAANNNKKRPPPRNIQNHGMRRIKKKKKKGGLFG